VFQGTPEELEEFDHPFNDEVIRSLEGFQEELTGLYSRRRFKVLYHGQLKRTGYGEAYSVVIFTLDSPEAIVDKWGYDAEQEAVRRMGGFINKHLDAIGGFSTRYSANQFVTVLPYSDLDEANDILKKFIADFKEYGIQSLKAGGNGSVPANACIDFSVQAGLAQGQPFMKIETVIEAAMQQQKEIGRVTCSAKE